MNSILNAKIADVQDFAALKAMFSLILPTVLLKLHGLSHIDFLIDRCLPIFKIHSNILQ